MLLPLAAWAQQQTLLVLGDSLSAAHNIELEQGWVALLKQQLQQTQPHWQVINASISGETSSGGLTRLPELLQQHEPDLVLLELGANDGLRALPTRQLQNNLEAMIKQIRAIQAEVLLLGMQIPDNYGPVYQQRFAAVYADLAEQYKLVLVPFLLDGVASRPELMQADGLHPKASAQSKILDNIWPSVQAQLKR
ncbi:MAG: arylesterase [Gammaproteobacteria bacterium]|jgi:acyl-CoA thioesterase-1|nr:arylesterase [Gammaproteobacteria bacterium]